MTPTRDLDQLLAIMAALRDPKTGCAWDREQTFATIVPYTVEEAYEVADAVAREDLDDLRDELGDLLLQVVFHARMAEEQGAFDFGGVVEAINAKLIRRHPHVFGETRDLPPDAIKRVWAEIKRTEKDQRHRQRAASGRPEPKPSLLDDVPLAAPALTRADKLTRRAATVGFDWPETAQVVVKIHEELAEVDEAIAGGVQETIADEIGDLLFTVANLARHFDIDPEAALGGTNAKFNRRFRAVEEALAAEGRMPQDATLDEMEALWRAAREAERVSG